jgi:hypothetical protein
LLSPRRPTTTAGTGDTSVAGLANLHRGPACGHRRAPLKESHDRAHCIFANPTESPATSIAIGIEQQAKTATADDHG